MNKEKQSITLIEAKIELRVGLRVGYGDHEWEVIHFHASELDKEYYRDRDHIANFGFIYRNNRMEMVRGFEVTLQRGTKYGNKISKRLFNEVLYVPK